MRLELARAVVAQSDAVTLLHETGRYQSLPPADLDTALLRPPSKRTQHPLLGRPFGGLSRSAASASPTPPAVIPGRRPASACGCWRRARPKRDSRSSRSLPCPRRVARSLVGELAD